MVERYKATLNAKIVLTADQADVVFRRAIPFADTWGVQTRPLVHLLQEAYLQGLTDAVEAMEART